MSFQWIIDNAETISLDQKKVIGTTTTRSGVVRNVSRGGQVWRFDVKLPDGPRWTDYRNRIATAQALDRTTTATISLSAAGQSWLYAYQGNSVNITGFVATITQGSATITLTTSPTTASGYKFRAGDYIQLGSTGKVYQVAADVAYNSNTVTLNRPVIDATAAGVALRVAQNCVWTVICVEFPTWTLFSRDQVSWSGPFTFVENLV
jgi:hypothetical protein